MIRSTAFDGTRMISHACEERKQVIDTAFWQSLVQAHYGANIAAIQPFPESSGDERVVLQLDLADGTRWIMRGYRCDSPVPRWLSGCATPTTEAWLRSRAATLIHLEAKQYPAPRVVRSHTGKPVATAQGWCLLTITFVEGTVTQPTLDQLRLTAAALSRLHTLDLAPVADAALPFGRSWWDVEYAIPGALDQLREVEELVPAQWQPLFDAFRAALHTIERQHVLLTTIIHGDGWAGNAIHTGPEHVVLIDWEPAGRGVAVLDLARLVLGGHLDLDTPIAAAIEPDHARIAVMIEGYTIHRRLPAHELVLLSDAMRFTVAVGGAWQFAQLAHKQLATLAPCFERFQQRFAVAPEIAQIAQACAARWT